MTETILNVRIDVLEQNLMRHEDPSSWDEQSPTGLPLRLPNVRVEREVLEEFGKAIRRQVIAQLKSLEEIRNSLKAKPKERVAAEQVLEKAWKDYTRVYEKSQEIFRECLEFLGGLAFRDQKWDESICQVADELIGTCAQASGQRTSLTIPASQEALTKTLGRIIRVRFPEWTIWTLPFTAHEYGHVVKDEVQELKSFVEGEAARWIEEEDKQTLKGAKRDELAGQRALKRYQYHIEELLADAFATYTMGPAYAHAAILLRFNPAGASGQGDEQPGDVKRAYVIFSTLKKMSDELKGIVISGPYSKIIKDMEGQWKAALLGAQSPSKLEAAEGKRLTHLVDRIWDKFYEEFLPTAKYPHNGWQLALEWSQNWERQLRGADELSIPEVPSTSKVRDVLNAAWLCRTNNVDAIKRITTAAFRLCESIIRKRLEHPPPAEGRDPSPSHRPGK
jgi:hypothetical protein